MNVLLTGGISLLKQHESHLIKDSSGFCREMYFLWEVKHRQVSSCRTFKSLSESLTFK